MKCILVHPLNICDCVWGKLHVYPILCNSLESFLYILLPRRQTFLNSFLKIDMSNSSLLSLKVFHIFLFVKPLNTDLGIIQV